MQDIDPDAKQDEPRVHAHEEPAPDRPVQRRPDLMTDAAVDVGAEQQRCAGVAPLYEPPRRQVVDLLQRLALARAPQVVHVRPPTARADHAPRRTPGSTLDPRRGSGGTPGRWSRRHRHWSGPPRAAGRAPQRRGRRLRPPRDRPAGEPQARRGALVAEAWQCSAIHGRVEAFAELPQLDPAVKQAAPGNAQ